MKINYKFLKQSIKKKELNLNDFEKIISSYDSFSLSKSQARKLINLYEKDILRNIGILERNTSSSIKEKLEKDYKLERIIVKGKDESIDQTLKIGDLVYSFKVKDKLKNLQ